MLGDIAVHRDRFEADAAEAHYRQALALADALGLRPLIAHWLEQAEAEMGA